MKTNNGFTLIELMIVIAIIALLSTVVLSALNSARTRGFDASVKSNLSNIRPQADLYYDNNGTSYGTFVAASCPATVTAGSVFSNQNIISGIANALLAGGNGTRCVASDTAYAIAVGLKTAGQSWCIDSLGRSKVYAGTPTAAISGSSCN